MGYFSPGAIKLATCLIGLFLKNTLTFGDFTVKYKKNE
jgi:hypothetical protein